MSDPNQEFQAPPPPVVQAEPERQRPTYLMWAGVALFVVGILLLALIVVVFGVAGITLHAGTAGAICGLGILLFIFSFIPMPAVPNPPPKMSTVQTLTGIFFEPSSVFRNLRAHPRFAAAIILVGLLNGIYTVAFVRRVTPERIINFTVDKLEESPIKPPPEALAKMRTDGVEQQKSVVTQVGNVVKAVSGHFFAVAFLAALFLVAVLAFGGRMHYWQTYAVVAYVGVPFTIIQKGISFIILYLKAPEDIHPLLGQETLVYDNLGLLVSGKDHPVLFVIATTIGVLSFYRLWLSATGLREGGHKVSSSAAWGASITLFALFLLLGVAFAAIFPGFVS
jgi:hypothetical protein